jgi:hypothetical protein
MTGLIFYLNQGGYPGATGALRALPASQFPRVAGAPPGVGSATGDEGDGEHLLNVIRHISAIFSRDRQVDKAIQYIDAVDDGEFRDSGRRWLAMSIVNPMVLGVPPVPDELDEADRVPSDKTSVSGPDAQDSPEMLNAVPKQERKTERPGAATKEMNEPNSGPGSKKSPEQKKDTDLDGGSEDDFRQRKPEDFKTASQIAESISDPLLKAETLSAIAAQQASARELDQRQLAETNLQHAMEAIKVYFQQSRRAASITRILRAAVWPAGFGVLGLILGAMCVPLIGAYSEAVGRSLAKEIRSDVVKGAKT